MMGEIRPGPGWRQRDDDKYTAPTTWAQFMNDNQRYINCRVPAAVASEHADTLVKELVEEKRLGRVIGLPQTGTLATTDRRST